jgi:hypothetical protein
MIGARWGHEVRRVGVAVLAVPPAVAALAGFVAAVARGSGSAPRVVPGTLETLLPLAAGVVAVSAISRDRSRELQLSLPASYRATLARRAGLGLGAVVVSAGILTTAVIAAGAWRTAPGLLSAQLVWLAPAVFLTALGVAVCLLTASGGLGAVAIGALWLIEVVRPALFVGRSWQPLFLFADGVVPAAPFHSGAAPTAAWWQDRAVLCLAALALLVIAAALARRPERLLRISL